MKNKSLYTYFGEDKAMAGRFGSMIQMYNAGKPFFWEDNFYPIEERLVKDGPKNDDDVLLVDIGGGDAGDLGRLRKALPDGKGRLVLQELAHIVELSDQDGYEAQVADWNEVQPVKGMALSSSSHAHHTRPKTDLSSRGEGLHAPSRPPRLQQRRGLPPHSQQHHTGDAARVLEAHYQGPHGA